MSITKHGRYFWLDIYIKGKRFRRSLKTTNKLEALDRYKEKKEELESKYLGKNLTFSDFCDQYLKWAWSSKPASALREEQRLEKIKEFFKEQEIIYLDEITSYNIEQLKAWLKEQKVTEERTLSKTTTNRYLQLLRGLFYKASAWGVYKGQNPIRGVRFYKERSPIEPLSDSQVKKIMDAAERMNRWPKSATQKEFFKICTIALNTGMRKSEILSLKWEDLKKDMIYVMGKGDKDRLIPINENVQKILEAGPRRSPYIIDIPNRGAQDALRKSVEKIRKETEIHWNFHQLRHYFATKLLEKGVDLVTIASILGHSKFTTSLIYSHTDKNKMKRAVNLLID